MQVEITKEEYEHLDSIHQDFEQATIRIRVAEEARDEAAQKVRQVLDSLQRKYRLPSMPSRAVRQGGVYRLIDGVQDNQPRQTRESFDLTDDPVPF